MPVSLNIISVRFLSVPYKLYGSYENLRLKICRDLNLTVCEDEESDKPVDLCSLNTDPSSLFHVY